MKINVLTGGGNADGGFTSLGGVLTGPLILFNDPTHPLEAATKNYVDNADALKVNKSGDTLTGHLSLHANPSTAMHAATKQYVDTADNAIAGNLSNHAADASLHITPAQNAMLDAVTASAAELNNTIGTIGAIQTQLSNIVAEMDARNLYNITPGLHFSNNR